MNFIAKILQNRTIAEFMKFCIVGVVCTAIDAGVFYAVHSLVGYRIAMILGFCTSIAVNYMLNIHWSFKSKPTFKNAVGILIAHCFNIFIVRMSLMWLFVDLMQMTDSIAYIPTLFISVITNFLVIRLVLKNNSR